MNRYTGDFKVYPINNHFVDVRCEEEYLTEINIKDGKIKYATETPSSGIFIRIFKNNKWFMTSTTDEKNIKNKIKGLDELADNVAHEKSGLKLNIDPIQDNLIKYEHLNPSKRKIKDKIEILREYDEVIKKFKYIRSYQLVYNDKYLVKRIKNSLGTDIAYDKSICGFTLYFTAAEGGNMFSGSISIGNNTLDHLMNKEEALKERLKEVKGFLKAKHVKEGSYTTVLSESATGVFVHESFGHKSEADFMIGDKSSQNEWAIGEKVANEKVSIIDYGGLPASCGYIPYDDEGVPSYKTYLVKDGVLSSRLHTLTTASLMGERPTGNGRSVDAEHEPIVRMTNTYMKRGDIPFEDMISDIKIGVYIKTVHSGFGMSTFTLTPGLSYMIRKGKIAEPVIVSAVAGSIFETLESIEAVSNDFKLIFNAQGGCSKLNQTKLPVGFGGPKIRIKSLEIS